MDLGHVHNFVMDVVTNILKALVSDMLVTLVKFKLGVVMWTSF